MCSPTRGRRFLVHVLLIHTPSMTLASSLGGNFPPSGLASGFALHGSLFVSFRKNKQRTVWYHTYLSKIMSFLPRLHIFLFRSGIL